MKIGKYAFAAALLLGALTSCGSRQPRVAVADVRGGSMLTADGKPMFVRGMNWDYFPIGTNWAYSLWKQPGNVIREALDREMSLLKDMGVNAVRQYANVPPRWIRYIYERYGIWTMINHPFGRYGLVAGGVDYSHTDYGMEDVRETLLRETEDFVNTYKDTPGVLLYLIGNENNYGLSWEGAETEDIPETDSLTACRARSMYRLMNEAARRIKAADTSHPVAICNGDLLYMEIIAEECRDVDILGVNCYRGESFDVLFRDVKEKYGRPVLLTEFGSDALNAVTQREAQRDQAEILLSNWREIYLNAAGMGGSGNCLGGFTFQFSDGWWKYDQKINLDVHDTHASWANGGYRFDYVKGEKNMNEEWFGVCAKGMPDSRGLYDLQPRQACDVLKAVHRLSPDRDDRAAIVDNFDVVRAEITK